ncbi:hypothetical protein GGI11_007705, partial [Coemansia sp. RSA 2049]
MAKSRLLKTALKSNAPGTSNESEPPTLRPRTAGGEKGLLRRLRIGRLFFGLGLGPSSPVESNSGFGFDAAAGSSLTTQQYSHPKSARMSGSESDLLARSSRLTPMPLLPTEQHRPGHADNLYDGMQTISVIRRHKDSRVSQANPSETQQGRFSIVSRRSSAPDISELAQQLGRRIESTSPQLSETSGLITQALSPQGSQHSQAQMLSPRRTSVDYSNTDVPNTNEQSTGPSIAYHSSEAAHHTHCDTDKKNNRYNGALS